MRWTKLKQNVESRFAPSLNGRVRLHTAHYHDAHDTEGRGWITVDGKEIVMFCEFRGRRAERQFINEYQEAHPGVPAWEAQQHAMEWASGSGNMTHSGYYAALWAYIHMSIDDALTSTNVLIRALAMLDSRTGKRRLRKVMPEDLAHPLVERMFVLRCEAEGIHVPESVRTSCP